MEHSENQGEGKNDRELTTAINGAGAKGSG